MVTYEYMSRNMRIYATSAHGVNITETQMSYFKVGILVIYGEAKLFLQPIAYVIVFTFYTLQ